MFRAIEQYFRKKRLKDIDVYEYMSKAESETDKKLENEKKDDVKKSEKQSFKK